jgi:hypothetical protein
MQQKTDSPDTLFFVISEKLSDGSVVYNVVLGEHKWQAVDQDEARDLAHDLAEAINDHTTNTAGVVDETNWE